MAEAVRYVYVAGPQNAGDERRNVQERGIYFGMTYVVEWHGRSLRLPEEPVDGAVVKSWTLAGPDFELVERIATYYRNTSWKEFSGDDGSAGRDLIDEWTVSERGHLLRRWTGWTSVARRGLGKGAYATRDDALRASIARLGARVEACDRESIRTAKLVLLRQAELSR